MNDLIAGSIGGCVGTILNTPCVSRRWLGGGSCADGWCARLDLTWSSRGSRTPPAFQASSPSTTGLCPRWHWLPGRRDSVPCTRASSPRSCVSGPEEAFSWWCSPWWWITGKPCSRRQGDVCIFFGCTSLDTYIYIYGAIDFLRR